MRFRHTVWNVLFLAFAGSLAADAYSPDIVKSQVVKLDASAIERYANTKTQFELALGDVRFELVLAPAPVVPKEGVRVIEVAEDGSAKESIVQEDTFTYAGDVVGEDPGASEARFAIYDGILEGYVYSKTGWWFIEPLSRFDPKAGSDQYLVYATRDLDFAVQFDDGGAYNDEVVDYGGSNDGRIPIVMAADREYIEMADQFRVRQEALINQVNGIYRDQIQREFKIVAKITDPHDAFITSTDPNKMLDGLSDLVRSRGGLAALHGELTHLTTGRDIDGPAGGIARFGERSLSQQERGITFKNSMLAAHEIGHNFNARHDLADEWCVTEFLGVCLDHEHSIMWWEFNSDNQPRFSDGTRNPNHNNVQQIDSNMSSRGFPRQPWL